MDNLPISDATIQSMNEKDKNEVRRFLEAEAQKARMQAST
jgi:hypothetical protein